MKIRSLVITGFTMFAVGCIIRCNIDTASGPTPYTVFKGETKSSSSIEIGLGNKTLVIPGSLPIVGSGRKVYLTVKNGDSVDTNLVMKGVIDSYNSDNGNMSVTVTQTKGSGTYNEWDVVLGKRDAEIQDSIRQAYTDLDFGMFFHFNMSTFDRCCCDECYSVSGEWGLGRPGKEVEEAKKFNPGKLNCGQWADVAKSAGCTYMVLTTKHHDGFCLWPSKYTDYCVKNAGVTTDVCRAFVDSARARGMKVGFYYSIRDLTNGHTLDFVKGQLTELLTEYGDIICLWFDGWGWGPGYNQVPYETIKTLIKSIQPNCLIVENNHEFTTLHSEMIEYEMPIDGPPSLSNTRPAEGNEPIRKDKCWFWHPNFECELMSAQDIVRRLKDNNTGNASYLLDLTPDTSGLIPQCQVDRMKEAGQLLGVPQ